MLTNYRPVWFG